MKGIFIGIGLIFFYSSVSSQLLKKVLRDEEKILGLSTFWSEAKYTFAHFDNVSQLNWDSAYQAFIPKVIAAKTAYEYGRVLQRFCALLKDGHSDILFGFGFYYDTLCSPPLHIKNIGHRAYITWVPDSLKKKVISGSEIIAVDGKPVVKYLLEDVFPYISESTQESLWTSSISKMLVGIVDTKVTISFKKPNGESGNLTLARNYKINRVRELEGNDPAVHFKWLDNDIVYLKIVTFSNEKLLSQFTEQLPSLYKAKGIIIDIRDNTGGNDEYAAAVAEYFLNTDSIRGIKTLSRQHLGAYKAWARNYKEYQPYLENNAFVDLGNNDYEINTTKKKILAPLVILTGTRTRSASEDFIVMFDNAKRATLIGETTGGTTGQPYFFKLTGTISACLCSIKNTFPDGRKFVGLGIKPAIEVKETIQDFLSGRDVVLEKALEYLQKN